ncbi:Cell wall-associated polypeptide CWBP200 [uncultured Clostridium sp.]|nr:Cell wall-associated polypeptide CWBP200 [uncultured Clostridium sp.]
MLFLIKEYTYDTYGNQTQKKVYKTEDGVNTLESTTDYTYDQANQLSTTHQTFEDDGQDDITTGNLYNGNGQRIRLTWNGSLYQKYYYMGSALFFTTDANNLRDSENILSPGGSIVASRRQDSSDANKYYFYHTDIRGSVTNIVGTKENAIYLAQGYNYDNFGKEELKSESSFKNDVTFTGAVSDSMTGLYYMNARHYDPDTGRFLQQDTYKGSAAVPWTQHLYAYTGNNPVNMVDPTGHYTNTASDQYANYRYDFEKKTLVPIVNYSSTAQDPYQGYYGKRNSTISKGKTTVNYDYSNKWYGGSEGATKNTSSLEGAYARAKSLIESMGGDVTKLPHLSQVESIMIYEYEHEVTWLEEKTISTVNSAIAFTMSYKLGVGLNFIAAIRAKSIQYIGPFTTGAIGNVIKEFVDDFLEQTSIPQTKEGSYHNAYVTFKLRASEDVQEYKMFDLTKSVFPDGSVMYKSKDYSVYASYFASNSEIEAGRRRSYGQR